MYSYYLAHRKDGARIRVKDVAKRKSATLDSRTDGPGMERIRVERQRCMRCDHVTAGIERFDPSPFHYMSSTQGRKADGTAAGAGSNPALLSNLPK